MVLRAVRGTLVLLAAAALFTLVGKETQAPAHEAAPGTAAQSQAKSSTKPSPSLKGRKIPCKIPENALLCYWTYGRLSIYNGSPSFRIWRIGNRPVLAIF